MGPKGAWHQDELADWPSVVKSTSNSIVTHWDCRNNSSVMELLFNNPRIVNTHDNMFRKRDYTICDSLGLQHTARPSVQMDILIVNREASTYHMRMNNQYTSGF
jgi:hypothetical protein